MKDLKFISIFKNTAIFDALWMLFACAGLLFFLIRTVVYPYKGEILSLIAFQLFFIGLLAISLYVLAGFKRIIIDMEKQKLTYYNLIRPFGRTLELKNFIGYIRSFEITSEGDIKTVYLVNDKGHTQFKIIVKYYKNANRLLDLIGLKEIKNYDFGVLAYLKLIFIGKIKIVKDC